MNNNPDVPDGWAMSDEMAKKVNEALNNKPISPEDELADALGDMVQDIALIEPDPMDWSGWVTYLLEQMEAEALTLEDELKSFLVITAADLSMEAQIKLHH